MSRHPIDAPSDALYSIDLAVIIVSFNVHDVLRQCLAAVAAAVDASGLNCETIVVDNASVDGSAAMVRDKFPNVAVLELTTNLGFAGANNVALRLLGVGSWEREGCRSIPPTSPNAAAIARASKLKPRYVLLLNPDTEVARDSLERMVRYLDRHPEVVVVGPQLRYGDGTHQSSRRRFPTIGTLFWESTLLEQWWPQNPWARRYRIEQQFGDVVQEVDWLVGAALMVRRSTIELAGLLDDQFFMYSEELEWQARLGKFGKVVYLPDAVVMHHEGKSSEQNLARRHINFNRSKLRYAAMRWGRPVAWLLRCFLLMAYTLQIMIEGLKWLLGHKRSLRQQRLVQYSTILRSGL